MLGLLLGITVAVGMMACGEVADSNATDEPSPGDVDAGDSTDSGTVGDSAQSNDGAIDADAAIDACVVSTSNIKYTKVVTGYEDSVCALDQGGAVRCWGDAWVEDPATHVVSMVTNALTTPTVMAGLDTSVIDIGAGDQFMCALKSSGAVLCWGKNDLGQLGDAAFTQAARALPAPVQGLGTAKHLALGYAHSCVILDTMHVQCWGSNELGVLGNASVTSGGSGSGVHSATPVEADAVTTAVDLKAAMNATCARLGDGSLKCWGWAPTNPAAGVSSGIADFDLGAYGGCALTTTNTLKCWGEARAGTYTGATLGDAQEVPGLSAGFKAFKVRDYGACVVMNAGGAKCWGLFFGGRTPATGYLASPSVPVDMASMGTHISDIRAGLNGDVYGYDAVMHDVVRVSKDSSGHTENGATSRVELTSPTSCGPAPMSGVRYWAEQNRARAFIDDDFNVFVDKSL